jgi:hypothetical protein
VKEKPSEKRTGDSMLSIMAVSLDGTPIPGAVVRVAGQGSKVADADARVTFDGLADGGYFAAASLGIDEKSVGPGFCASAVP